MPAALVHNIETPEARRAADGDYIAPVTSDILDLSARYLANRKPDVERLRTALATHNFSALEDIGERMFAAGAPHGFRKITLFGKQIRAACAERDAKRLWPVVAEYEDYLAKVKLVVVDPPTLPQWPRILRVAVPS
jgi:hypothetical protein